jgi:hypothetical protein
MAENRLETHVIDTGVNIADTEGGRPVSPDKAFTGVDVTVGRKAPFAFPHLAGIS